jgi:murein DD-endopeptidase MepM/ murein hydrolase activator NlpD
MKKIHLIGAVALFCGLAIVMSIMLIGERDPAPQSPSQLDQSTKLMSHIKTLPTFLDENLVGNYVKIDRSFIQSCIDAGIPSNISYQAAKIFESLIDFSKDIHQGDEFFVIYEVGEIENQVSTPKKVVAAEIVNQGKSFRAVLHTNEAGRDIYLSPDGKSLELDFLKSPIQYSKVSSEFSTSRFHPILKQIRMHKGIDYSASTGTEVRAVADGIVHYMGYKGGYGKLIIIRHLNAKETRYGHLSAYSGKIHQGGRVTKGQVIGYVGMTGLATAPHLHFEFINNGKYVNPREMPREPMPFLHLEDSSYFIKHVSAKILLLDQFKNIVKI